LIAKIVTRTAYIFMQIESAIMHIWFHCFVDSELKLPICCLECDIYELFQPTV